MSRSEMNGYKIVGTYLLRDTLDSADLHVNLLANGNVRIVAVLNGKRVKIPKHIVWEFIPDKTEVVRHGA